MTLLHNNTLGGFLLQKHAYDSTNTNFLSWWINQEEHTLPQRHWPHFILCNCHNILKVMNNKCVWARGQMGGKLQWMGQNQFHQNCLQILFTEILNFLIFISYNVGVLVPSNVINAIWRMTFQTDLKSSSACEPINDQRFQKYTNIQLILAKKWAKPLMF